MASGKWILIASITVVLAAIGLGLILVGGPQQGRLDQRDEDRFDDLTAMLWVLECHYREEGVFPESFEKQQIIAECRQFFPPDADLSDGTTNQPYPYVHQTDQRISLCAPFESTPERLAILFGNIEPDFVPETGCITVIRD
jgi:hypothetical protein